MGKLPMRWQLYPSLMHSTHRLTHVPDMHSSVASQAISHPPQFASSVSVLMQRLSQHASPALVQSPDTIQPSSISQLPALHRSFAAQVMPQAPQFISSFANEWQLGAPIASTQQLGESPVQIEQGFTHCALIHSVPVAQVRPQPPQFISSSV